MADIQPLEQMREYFNSGVTRPYHFRIEQLKKLKASIEKHEQELYSALSADLNKSPEESWVTENGMVLAELNVAIKNLRHWMRPERPGTNLLNFPSSSRIIKEPMGVVLIIATWNYPLQMALNPLVGAIAAGNCAVVKPSEHAVHTAAVIRKILEAVFPPSYILTIEGDGAILVPPLMDQFRFDYVFFTGSTAVGRQIYKMAADKLVPVTLELGGKTPCIVEDDANIPVTARRIAVTKFSNAGQMCVAPDFILVKESVKDKLIEELKSAINKFFSEKPEKSYSYGRIINETHFDRLAGYLEKSKIVSGGKTEKSIRYIEPTIITDVSPDHPFMKEEIFGPVLPIISFKEKQEALAIIQQSPNPLAFYVYTSSRKKEDEWLEAVPAGGSCINNCSWHLTNHHLPFGGRGYSGMGNYHGKYSFETFSHKRSVMKTPTWFDPKIKYPPFDGKLMLYKWFIK